MLLYLSISQSTQDNAFHIEDPYCTSVLWINQPMNSFYRSERLCKEKRKILESVLKRSGLSNDLLFSRSTPSLETVQDWFSSFYSETPYVV